MCQFRNNYILENRVNIQENYLTCLAFVFFGGNAGGIEEVIAFTGRFELFVDKLFMDEASDFMESSLIKLGDFRGEENPL